MFTHLLRVPTSRTFDPLAEVQREFDEIFSHFAAPRRRAAASEASDEGEHYRVTLDVPGLRAEDLDLQVTEDGLTVTGTRTVAVPEGFEARRRERKDYSVSRSFRFRKKVDPQAVEATFDAGVLTVTLGKRAEAKPRSITVRSRAA